MVIRTVLTWPDERLREIATDVDVVDARVLSLIEDLFETMYDQGGIGLAATQIGDGRRVVVVDCVRAARERNEENQDDRGGDDGGQPIAIVNGRIVEREGTVIWREGCLSLPGVTAEVERSARITVEYLDRAGDAQRLDATGLLAVCIQHELDHLDGQLYIDRLGQLERKATISEYDEARNGIVPELRS